MYGLFGGGEIQNLAPQEVADGMKEGRILLIDVREPNETDIERIPGSTLLPLSTLDPTAIPDPDGRTIVFSCRSGNRSVKACEMAQAAGLSINAHLAGGIKAWKEAGLPVEP
jgi:rhodanese-related sulfurtransferase